MRLTDLFRIQTWDDNPWATAWKGCGCIVCSRHQDCNLDMTGVGVDACQVLAGHLRVARTSYTYLVGFQRLQQFDMLESVSILCVDQFQLCSLMLKMWTHGKRPWFNVFVLQAVTTDSWTCLSETLMLFLCSPFFGLEKEVSQYLKPMLLGFRIRSYYLFFMGYHDLSCESHGIPIIPTTPINPETAHCSVIWSDHHLWSRLLLPSQRRGTSALELSAVIQTFCSGHGCSDILWCGVSCPELAIFRRVVLLSCQQRLKVPEVPSEIGQLLKEMWETERVPPRINMCSLKLCPLSNSQDYGKDSIE